VEDDKKKGNLKGDASVKISGGGIVGAAGFAVQFGIPSKKAGDEGAREILLGADLLEYKGYTPDGQIIEYIEIPWLAIAEEMKQDSDFVFTLDPRKFEEFIAASYEREGWTVELTPRSGDKGRDVIATRNDFGSLRIYDEVKRYGPGQRVSAETVRALSGVISGHQNVSKGVVTTTSEFAPGVWTDPAIEPLMPNRLELRDGKRLLDWVKTLAGKKRK
jgi:restriction system protein